MSKTMAAVEAVVGLAKSHEHLQSELEVALKAQHEANRKLGIAEAALRVRDGQLDRMTVDRDAQKASFNAACKIAAERAREIVGLKRTASALESELLAEGARRAPRYMPIVGAIAREDVLGQYIQIDLGVTHGRITQLALDDAIDSETVAKGFARRLAQQWAERAEAAILKGLEPHLAERRGSVTGRWMGPRDDPSAF